jgi:biotin-dependent carboxylase-like uncharacterized protein
MTRALFVVQAGPLTTIQDAGRRGYQRYGVPVAGAMDNTALAIANRLVGNSVDSAAVEFAVTGARFRCGGDPVTIAVAGAVSLSVDGQPLGNWRTFTLRRGQTASIAPDRHGMFGYMAIGGGLDLPPVFGSLSTHLRSAIGPFDGRALQTGDRLPIGNGDGAAADRFLPSPPARPDLPTIRVVLGPQDNFFDDIARATLIASPYRISRQSDRMGFRLEGAAMATKGAANIISEGIAPGSIQVPGDGQPIVLMADRQTVGGYPKIGTVISADMNVLAQGKPGSSIQFVSVSLEEAIAALRDYENWLANIDSLLLTTAQA